mmetsp:Transcript_6844/g.41743  ORF Transcript_6844/g.41743 Transcript_6844/m.41743 type:complete len:111 (-) Transcript_6844:1093-1425(-)
MELVFLGPLAYPFSHQWYNCHQLDGRLGLSLKLFVSAEYVLFAVGFKDVEPPLMCFCGGPLYALLPEVRVFQLQAIQPLCQTLTSQGDFLILHGRKQAWQNRKAKFPSMS